MHKFLAVCSAVFLSLSLPLGSAAADPKRIVIRADQTLESAGILAHSIAVQGMPLNSDDEKEAEFWRRLGPRTEGVALIGDADYFGFAIHVHRSAKKDVPVENGRLLWQGPFGPQRDLWIDTRDFDGYLEYIKKRMDLQGDKIFFSLGSTPKTLSINPESDQHMYMCPSSYEEWEAVVEAAVRHLVKIGYSAPVLLGPSTEPESYFLGRNRSKEDRKTIAFDYAEMFVRSFRAVERANPKAKLVATGNVTYSGQLTAELQGDPEQWGVEDFLESVHQIDPKLKMEGFAVQGYFWRGLNGYGRDRLVAGARHIADLLASYGHRRNVPQYIQGWNPVLYNGEFDESKFFTPKVTQFHREVMDKMGTWIVSEAIRYANPGGEKLIDTAFFYTWNGDCTPGCQGGFTRAALVSTVHEGGKAGEDGTFTYPDCYQLASDVACARVPYEAMMFLKEASQGHFVRVDNLDESEDIQIAAVIQKDAIRLLAAHSDAKPLAGLSLEIRGLQPGIRYHPRFQTLRSDERLCAAVEETPQAPVTANSQGVIRLAFPGKQSMFFCTLERLS